MGLRLFAVFVWALFSCAFCFALSLPPIATAAMTGTIVVYCAPTDTDKEGEAMLSRSELLLFLLAGAVVGFVLGAL